MAAEQKTFFDVILSTNQKPTHDDADGIAIIDFAAFWHTLHSREEKFITVINLVKFMKTLGGKNKSGSENTIGRLQYFINAFSQELALFLANQGYIRFVGDDHYYLTRGATGTDDPDFCFTTKAGTQFTIEAKMYFSEASYHNKKATTNFHKADYCLAYIISSAKWRVSHKIDNYNTLYDIEELAKYYPQLLEIVLPNELTTVQFSIPNLKLSDLTDDQLPEKVNYTFYTKRNTTYDKVVNL